MLAFIALLVSLGVTAFGFVAARSFVRDRLKFVDAAQSLKAPIIAGLVAWAIATPLTWFVPFIGPATAIFFGLSVGLGVRAGARDIRVERRITGGY